MKLLLGQLLRCKLDLDLNCTVESDGNISGLTTWPIFSGRLHEMPLVISGSRADRGAFMYSFSTFSWPNHICFQVCIHISEAVATRFAGLK